jgi:hypothetical protein
VRLPDRARQLAPFNHLTDIFLRFYTGPGDGPLEPKLVVHWKQNTGWSPFKYHKLNCAWRYFNSHGTRENKNILSIFETADLPGKTPCTVIWKICTVSEVFVAPIFKAYFMEFLFYWRKQQVSPKDEIIYQNTFWQSSTSKSKLPKHTLTQSSTSKSKPPPHPKVNIFSSFSNLF